MITVHPRQGADLPLSNADALNLLRVVSDAATDFMIAYPGPESERLVWALDVANRLAAATTLLDLELRELKSLEAA